MENTQTNKPQSRWTASTVGKLWSNKDQEGKTKNFSGTLTIDGKERRIIVMKRLKNDNDDPNKNYPSLIIYDSEKLDSFNNDSAKSARATTNKTVVKAAPVEEEVAEELI
jgi:hypothetical protein